MARCLSKIFTKSKPFSRPKHTEPTLEFKPPVVAALNEQIFVELSAGYAYLTMATYFGSQNVTLTGCQKFFLSQVTEEYKHSKILIDFILQRGGQVVFQCIDVPEKTSWSSAVEAFQDALRLEQFVGTKIVQACHISQQHGDESTCDLLQSYFMKEQNASVDTLTRYVNILTRMGTGLGVQIFDQKLQKDFP